MNQTSSEPTIQELFDLSGKSALITGATGWLGSSMARALAEAGASVIISSRGWRTSTDSSCHAAYSGQRHPRRGRAGPDGSEIDRKWIRGRGLQRRRARHPRQQRPRPGGPRPDRLHLRGIRRPPTQHSRLLHPRTPDVQPRCRTQGDRKHHYARVDVWTGRFLPGRLRRGSHGEPRRVSRAQGRHHPYDAPPRRLLRRTQCASQLHQSRSVSEGRDKSGNGWPTVREAADEADGAASRAEGDPTLARERRGELHHGAEYYRRWRMVGLVGDGNVLGFLQKKRRELSS